MAEMLDSFRQQNPAYKDVPDDKLADGLYKKFYSDKMDRAAFDQKVGISAPASGDDGITGPASLVKNAGQGVNRFLGTAAGAADYALLGFLDDTKEGRSKRPLGYVSNLLRGEEDIPGTGGAKFSEEPTTRGEEIVQRGGEVLGEGLASAGVMGAVGKWLAKQGIQPTASAVEWALSKIAQGQASLPALTGEAVGSFGAGVGEEVGREATPGSVVGPVVGGIVGGLSPAVATMPMVRSAVSKAVNSATNYLSPTASAKRAKTKVLEEIGPHIEGDATQARLRQAENVKKEIERFDPDLAQVTRSEALKESKRDVVKRASGSDLETIRAREAANQQAIQDYARKNAPEGQGGADEALEPLVMDRERAAQQVRQIEEQRTAIPDQKRSQELAIRDKATERLESLAEREKKLPSPRDVVETERMAMDELTSRTNGARADIAGRVQRIDRSAEGARVREGIKAERSRRKVEIDKMAKDLKIDDLQVTTPFRSFARSVDKWRDGLLPSQLENMPGVADDIQAIRTKERVTFNDIKALRESMVDEVLEATRDSSPGHRKRLANVMRLREMLDEQVLGFDTLEGGFPDAAPFIDKAKHYAGSESFDDLMNAAKFASGKSKPFMTLSDFIVQQGGIRESGGELFARDIKSKSRPGLYRKKGMSHEDATLAAWEAGYFPGKTERPGPDDLRNALNDDLNGRARYREQDMDDASRLGEKSDVAEDLSQTLDDLGIEWHNATPDEIRARIDEMAEEPIDRSAAADNWKEFRRSYFEKIIEPFERGQVKKSTSKDGTGFYRTLDEEVALGFLNSADAAEQISRIAETQPKIMASLEAVALDDLASKAVSNGVINPRSLERWLEKRGPALQHLPAIRKTVAELASVVADVEGKFQRGKKIIRDRKLGEQKRLDQARAAISQEKQAVRRAASGEIRRIGQDAVDAKSRLQAAMDPLLERMGAHNERKMALEDTQLARRLAGIASGTATPVAVIEHAVSKPDLMKKLWQYTESYPDARKALQRHIWDGLTGLDSASLKGFLESSGKSLRIVFGGKHLARLKTISDALEMAEFAPATGSAKPISTNLNDKIKDATGMNVSAAAAAGAAVSRGRSSKQIEGLRILFNLMTERGRQGYEKLIREALFNPDVAKGLIESAQYGPLKKKNTRLEDFASRRLKGWLWQLGIGTPLLEDEER